MRFHWAPDFGRQNYEKRWQDRVFPGHVEDWPAVPAMSYYLSDAPTAKEYCQECGEVVGVHYPREKQDGEECHECWWRWHDRWYHDCNCGCER